METVAVEHCPGTAASGEAACLERTLSVIQGFMLAPEELRWLLEAELQSAHVREGGRGAVRVWLEPAPGYLIDEAAGRSRRGPLHERLGAAAVIAAVQRHFHHLPAGRRRRLAYARCVAVRETFSEIALARPQLGSEPAGTAPHMAAHSPLDALQRAVLPHGELAFEDRRRWPPGDGFYVSVHFAGMASLHPWRASRAESAFLRLLSEHFLERKVRSELFRGAGMVIFEPGADLGAVIGPGGRTVEALRCLAGLRHLHLVREPGPPSDASRPLSPVQRLPDEARLRSALCSFGLWPAHLTPPASPGGSWMVRVPAGQAKHLRERGGVSLTFVKRLAGVPVQLTDRAADQLMDQTTDQIMGQLTDRLTERSS